MLVLIATHDARSSVTPLDGGAVDGELVAPVLVECDEPHRCPCRCSWAGLVTAGFSAVAEIADRPNLTRADVRRAVHDLLDRIGWIDDLVQASESGDTWFDGFDVADPVAAVDLMVDEHIAQIDQICRSFPVGTMVSRLGDLVAPTVGSRAA
jgi:hypothetical protein